MAYRFNLAQSVAANARRIALGEIDSALALCGNQADRAEAAHELRKRTKRLRALMRLLRGPLQADGRYEADNAFLRDAARDLGSLRDAEALVESYDKLMGRYVNEIERRHFAPLRRALTLARRQIKADDDFAARLARFRDRMTEARERVEDWQVDEDGFGAVREGLTRTYRSGRKAMSTAFERPSGENLHAWRKHAKHHWYHMRLLQPLWKKELRPRRDASKELGELLGNHHDLTLLRAHFGEDGARVQELGALITRRAGELTFRARIVGERLYAAKPKAFASEMGGWWQAAIEEIAADAAD
jgi:CHAD domain-containing protein